MICRDYILNSNHEIVKFFVLFLFGYNLISRISKRYIVELRVNLMGIMEDAKFEMNWTHLKHC